MAINSVSLENFTVFEKINIEFCPGINVFIGENGTGKTHLLKVLYAWCESETHDIPDVELNSIYEFWNKLFSYLQITHPQKFMRDLHVIDPDKKHLNISVDTRDGSYYVSIILTETDTDDTIFHMRGDVSNKNALPSIFIPAKDMLTHSGIEKDFTKRNLPFDTTLIDILNNAGVSTLKELDAEMTAVLNTIAKVIGGKVVYSNNKYFIYREGIGHVEFALEAEGYKKLGLIYRLIETGEIKKGSILFWDEPEANLNPKLIPHLVDIILELEQAGVQMFFATHDYFFAKFLEVRKKKNTSALYHALHKEGNSVLCESNKDFELLENNSIIAQSIALYKEEVEKVMG